MPSSPKARLIVIDRTTELSDRIGQVTKSLDEPADVLPCLRVSDVVELLDDERATVIVAGPGVVTRSGLARLELLHDNCPNLVLVLAFVRRPSAAMRDIVRAGAVDMIQLPADDESLAHSLNRAIGLARKSETAHASVAVAATPTEGHKRGRVVTLASATGGCGKTFLATNLAYLLAKQPNHRVCVVDLDLQFGEVSTTLHLRPRYTICDALQRDAD